jgi:hypothetical protein
VRDLTRIKGRCEAGEYSGTQGRNDFVRRTVTSQHDALNPRPDGTHLIKQCQVFLDSTVGISDDNTERPHAQPL